MLIGFSMLHPANMDLALVRSDASYENHNYLGRESVMSVPMSQQIHHPSQNYTNGTVTGYPHYNPAAHYFLQNQIHHLNKPPEHSTESPTTGNTPQAASANQESQHKTDSAKPPTLPEYRQPMVDEREVESSNENPDALREQNQEPKSERTESPGLSSERTDESKESRTEHSESRPEEPVESEQRPTRPTQENQTHSISKVPSSSEPGKPDPGFRFEGPTPSFEDLKESYKTEPPSNIAPYTSSPLVNSERGYPGPPPLRSFSPPTSTPSSSYSPFNHLPLRPISSEAGLHPKTDFRPDSRSSDSQSDISQSTSVPTTPTTSIPYLSPGTPQRLLGFPTTPTPPGIGRLDHSAPLLGSSEAHQNTNGNSKDIFFCHLCSYVGNSKYLFNAHMNTHFEHRCPQCDYTSRTEGRLKRHIKDFHSESPPDSFSGNKTMRSDASPAAMEAPPLDSSSPSPNGTPQSQQQQPGRPKVFKCKQCNYSTVIKTEFWEHSRSHIKEDKVLQCPKCPFVTEYKHHLEYHLRNHFGSKPFKCPKCNYACVNKSMLNSHMKSHTNVYQYRCADCTYATKYCHSLKLHLKKYNHKPATVLNPDGSLPVDGSGDFELVSKRGPPRGPRGPRKDSKSPPAPGMGPSIVLPNQGIPSPRAAAAAINGMMMPNFSPFMNPFMSPMANGMHPVQPMMPPMMSGLSPLNIQVPPEHHRLMQQSMMSGDMPQEKSPAHGSAVNKDIKCVLCSFKAENRVALNQHMFKVHAAENQDLFNMFGIPQEQLMEEAAKAAEMASAAAHAAALQARPLIITPKLERDDASEYSKAHSMDKPEEAQKDREHANHSPSQLDEQTQTWLRALQATGGIPSREMLAQMRQMHFNPQSMAKHLTAKERYNMALATDMAASIEAETKVNGEHPLDLTKPQHHPGLEHPPGELERLEYMVRAQKRSLPSDESSMSPGSQANQSDPATPAPSTSPTPRKRSRKGKAYKLDTICMKLQERYGDEEEAPQGDGLTESDDYNSEAGGEREEESKDGSDAENDGKEPNINYNEIHNSLRELNSDSENSQQKYPGEGEQVSAVEGAEMPRLSTPPKSSESGTIFSNTINRRKLFMMRHAEEQVQEALRSQLEQNGRDAMMKIGHMNLSLAAVNPQLAKNGDTYECTHCDILFRDCIMYTVHMGYHGYQDPFKCNMCGNLSKNRVEFFLHIARAAHD